MLITGYEMLNFERLEHGEQMIPRYLQGTGTYIDMVPIANEPILVKVFIASRDCCNV